MASEWACVLCHRAYAKGQPEQVCSDCRRYRAIGVLVENCVGHGRGYAALDAIADLLGMITRLRRRHNKEMRDEQLGAQRDTSAAYSQGRMDGHRSQDEW